MLYKQKKSMVIFFNLLKNNKLSSLNDHLTAAELN
jgi:hypothetical protein